MLNGSWTTSANNVIKRKGGPGKSGIPPLSADEISAFRKAVREAEPLPENGKISHPPQRCKPKKNHTLQEPNPLPVDFLSDHVPWQDNQDTNEPLSYLRPGMAQDTLRKLRRGHWGIQSELDMHGMTSDEARLNLVAFLSECQHHGLRCIRIIHGKGLSSKNGESVLKIKVKNWLMQRYEVLAFCQAKPNEGGGGAAIVLLKSLTI